MNPETNKFEKLTEVMTETELREKIDKLRGEAATTQMTKLLRPDGTEVPSHWAVFKVGEHIVIKDYTFEVKYIGETAILFEPVNP